jgi:hypothetical protein
MIWITPLSVVLSRPTFFVCSGSDSVSTMSESQVQKMNAELLALKQELQALKEAEPVRDTHIVCTCVYVNECVLCCVVRLCVYMHACMNA